MRSPLSISRWLLLGLAACSPTPFTPPDWPVHDEEHDDYDHARGSEYPFLCPVGADPARPEYGIECVVRTRTPSSSVSATDPEDAYLSCDAIGCHGGYDYRERGGLATGRHLLGSEGPSCYACHDVEWKKDEPKTGRYDFDEKKDDD